MGRNIYLYPSVLPLSFPLDSPWTGKKGKMRVGGGGEGKRVEERGSRNGKVWGLKGRWKRRKTTINGVGGKGRRKELERKERGRAD
jgi:hypothetical protein